MATTLREKVKSLEENRQKKIRARANQLIAEEMSLAALRRARELTQKQLAKELGIGQEGISRIEMRTDLMLSTLRRFIEAMDGKLRLVVEFKDRPPVILSGLDDIEKPEQVGT